MSKFEYKPVLPKTINRIAAFIIDAILLVILLTGILYLSSVVFHYDAHLAALESEYIKEGFLVLNPETNKYEYLSETASNYQVVLESIKNNKIIISEQNFLNSYTSQAPIACIAIVLFITEFIVPLFLGNGQTVGMKVFKIALISNNNIKISPLQLFARCLIGKIAILGVIPMFGVSFILFNPTGGLLGTLIIIVILIIQITAIMKNKNHAGIQDIIAQVYPVNYSETVIYRNKKELQEAIDSYNKPYKKGK